MKKVINYILGILLMAGMSSCGTDWLDLNPTTSVATNDALSTESDLQIALNGTYRQLGVHWFFGNRVVFYPELKGEDMQCYSSASRGYEYYSFTQTSGDQPVLTTWQEGYELIHNVNNIIDAIDNSGNFEATDSDVKEIRSECLALRALATFALTNMYGQIYSSSESALGICLMTKKEDTDYKPERATLKACYNQVITDMTEAIAGLPTQKTDGYLNKWAVEGLLSRVYLQTGDYANALTYAKDVIDNSPYGLCANADYAAMWGKDFPEESLFEIYYSETENVGYEFVGTMYSTGNNIILTDKYLDLLDEDPNDVRHCFTQTITADNTIPYVLTKYPGKDGTVDNPGVSEYNDLYIIRLSEVYLIAAECDFRVNSTSGNALTYLNAIVTRSNPAKSITSADLTLQRILDERRRELVGEGISGLYDIIRTRSASDVIDHTGGRHLADLTITTINCDDPLISSPIPTNEIVNNPNVKQNDGYSN